MTSSTPGRRLKAARSRMKLTQQDVAKRVNQSVTTYKGWEQDRSKPRTYSMISRLCQVLHITIDYYISGAENTVLQPEQQRLLEKYDQLSPDMKKAVDMVIEGILSQG